MNKGFFTLLLVAFSAASTAFSPAADNSECSACKLYLPNAFSPNNDGVNDTFRPEGNCSLVSYELQIFNRWGDQVFRSQSVEEGWNGEIKGKPAPSGVYIYLVKYATGEGELVEDEVATGDLALLR